MNATLNTVNKAIRAAGLKVRAVRGAGYYYWEATEPNFLAEGESVYTFRASDLPVEHWVGLARKVPVTPIPAPTSGPIRLVYSPTVC